MALYRILRPLSVVVRGAEGVLPQGALVTREQLGERAKVNLLMEGRSIAVAHLPPFHALDKSWDERATRLQRFEVRTPTDFMDADLDDLARRMSVTVATLEQWRDELLNELV